MKCLCDCGLEAKPGKRFIVGHSAIGKKWTEERKKKREQTCLRRYGFRNPTMNKEIEQKAINTRRRLGVFDRQSQYMRQHNPAKNPLFSEKYKQTCMKRYGVNNHMKVPEIAKKCTEARERNGGNKKQSVRMKLFSPMKRPEIAKKSANTKRKNGFYERISREMTDWDFFNKYGSRKSRYPYNDCFDRCFRKMIRDRDGNRCVVTGISNEEHLKLYGKSLSIHHWNYDKSSDDPYFLLQYVIQYMPWSVKTKSLGWPSLAE